MVRILAKLEPGGAQLAALRVATRLRDWGVETRLLAGWTTPAGRALGREYGFDVESYEAAGNLQWVCDDGFADWLAERIEGATVVHAHMFGAWWAAAKARRNRDGQPPWLLASEHNPYIWPAEPQEHRLREAVGAVDIFFAQGPSAKASLLAAGLPAQRLRDCPSPVVGWPAEPLPGLASPRIVFCGRLAPDKGPDLLLDVLDRMSAPPPVYMVGDGNLRPQLERRVAAGRADIRFAGWQRHPEGWIAGASVLALPSRDEAFSQTATLALGLGTPVVGFAVDGLANTLAECRGVLVDAFDVDAFAAAVQRVLDGHTRIDHDAGRRFAEDFALDRVAGHYLDRYRSLERGPLAA